MDLILTGVKVFGYFLIGAFTLEVLLVFLFGIFAVIGAILTKLGFGENYSDIKGDEDER